LATRTSRPAAHSRAEPWAMSKKRHRSFEPYLPLPSAIFSGIDVDARSNWSLTSPMRTDPSRSADSHATKAMASRYASSFS